MNSQRREPYVNGRKSDRAAGPRQPLKIEQLGSSGRSAGFKPIPAELSCRHVWAAHAAFRLGGQTFAPDGGEALRNLAPRQSLQWSGLDLLPAYGLDLLVLRQH